EVVVVDTTDPSVVLAAASSRDPGASLVIVSSPSGTDEETSALASFFQDRARRFVAVTHPDSPLERAARGNGYGRIFLDNPDIGGRYAALSFAGLVPAALLGVDLEKLLDRAARMSAACGPSREIEINPGVRLGAILAEAALA